MLPLALVPASGTLRLLAIGAHPDDIEIAAGGTLLRLVAEVADLRAQVVVLSATPPRAAEARAAAADLFGGAGELTVEVHDLADGHLPAQWGEVKRLLESLARSSRPDLILCPSPADAHQDHRLIGELVRTSFRDHLILHYEVPKWDGDLGATGATHYVPLDRALIERKCTLLRNRFPSQAGRDWFSDETFTALARLRGLECRARYAEAFAVGKALLDLTPVPSPT